MYWVAICHRVQKTNSTCLAARLLGDVHFYQPHDRRVSADRDDFKITYISAVIFPSSSLCLNAPSRSAAFGNTAHTVAGKQQGRNSDGTRLTLFLRRVAEAKCTSRNQAAEMTP